MRSFECTDSNGGSIVRRSGLLLCLLLSLLAVTGCDDATTTTTAPVDDPRTTFDLKTLGSIPYPPDNPPRQERIALGRLLFFDPILGGEQDVACGTCHHPDFGFADGRQFGAGTSGSGLGPSRIVSKSAITNQPVELEPRNSPSIWNVAFNADETGLPTHESFQFWDGRFKSLEVQATKPITSRVEMRGDAYPGSEAQASLDALDSVLARLRAIPEYVARFADAFPMEAAPLDSASLPTLIDTSTYSRAIASYERELVSRNSAYDRYVKGDDGALNDQELEGLELFFTKAKCSECHSGPMFSDFKFVVNGVPQEGTGKGTVPGDDLGREEHTGDPADRYKFRTPTLRNIALTPPYMHDGVFNTLEEVVQFYNHGARPRHASITDAMLPPVLVDSLQLTDAEVAAVVAFMEALTDNGSMLNPMLLKVPDAVPSGLMPVFGVAGPGSGVRPMAAHRSGR